MLHQCARQIMRRCCCALMCVRELAQYSSAVRGVIMRRDKIRFIPSARALRECIAVYSVLVSDRDAFSACQFCFLPGVARCRQRAATVSVVNDLACAPNLFKGFSMGFKGMCYASCWTSRHVSNVRTTMQARD